ncbi:sigma-70 family RNA polymerase sigma factor [Aggregicoccus sp. 17bor-14]|uniref:sigma-70 family RNA polymerase sigma factor n=1 Tax=Myxococcaceae TaxID=31 RepID=UPI00129CFB1D|nr:MULTISPECIES: sigma-70 family RNA polymerase sigma factor [Myxococcaceae]MBF5040810.1 sigma-70 family RNA polymerase sigma factor [Simulacricoccus sp. 17bor-14]MRI86598.1 sigma-70 family RNA polymerase sigma factor [Aggregicoccus sp. 17bor-14]
MPPSDSSGPRASEPAGDLVLVRRVAQGDATAMRELYARCGARAYGLVLRILPVRADADEVLQETFLEVWRRARQFDPARGGLESWVATIARTRAIDRMRTLASGARLLTGAAAEPPPVSAQPLDPRQSAEQQQDRERVELALRSLPPEQRSVVELAYFEGLSQSEIAERTATPLGTVKTRARLALAKLAELLQARAPGKAD